MEWSTVSADFEPDGGLRDIYVLDATLADWQAVVDALKREVAGLHFNVGGKTSELPDDISELFFRSPNDLTPCLNVPFGPSTSNCYFFSDDEIEFDLDPRVMKAELLPQLIDFLTLIGIATSKPVLLTMENMQEAQILRFEPSTKHVDYVGPAFSNE